MAASTLRSSPDWYSDTAQPVPRSVRCRRLQNRHMALLAGLLALTLSGLGCARDARPPTPAASPSTPPDSQSQQVALPTALRGVWYRDDAVGRAQCDRYRALPEDIGETDEGWISMIGSIVITPTLIHEYSEYGEGNFNVVKEIANLGDGSWQVKVHVGIDSMPDDDSDLEVEAYLLELQQEQLSWEPYRTNGEHAPSYFRCGDVRTDLYQIE